MYINILLIYYINKLDEVFKEINTVLIFWGKCETFVERQPENGKNLDVFLIKSVNDVMKDLRG